MIRKYTPRFVKSAIKKVLWPHSLHLSQAGQDLWVLGEVFNERRGGYFLDLGAHDGVFISNTYLLERKFGWTGICVEANPDSFQRLTKNRRAICVHACLDSIDGVVDFAKRDRGLSPEWRGLLGGVVSAEPDNTRNSDGVIQVKTRTLESILLEYRAPKEIDYLSIDIEGSEERVLGNFDFRKYRFNCMTIERPTDTLKGILKGNGYFLVREIPQLDCFYIHESLSEQYYNNLMAYYGKCRLACRWC